MSEPTIDEMIETLEAMTFLSVPPEESETRRIMASRIAAIRAILEEHRNLMEVQHLLADGHNHLKVAVIHAFVERVNERAGRARPYDFEDAMQEELAAMEKEAE